MDILVPQIHPVADDASLDAVNDGDGSVARDRVHQSHMRQAIVLAAVPIAVVGLPEEDEISWLGRSAHVDFSMRLGVPVDRLHTAIPPPPAGQQIDPQGVEQRSDEAGAIAWVFLTAGLDRRASQKSSGEGDQALTLWR